jgi:hypothetical protein
VDERIGVEICQPEPKHTLRTYILHQNCVTQTHSTNPCNLNPATTTLPTCPVSVSAANTSSCLLNSTYASPLLFLVWRSVISLMSVTCTQHSTTQHDRHRTGGSRRHMRQKAHEKRSKLCWAVHCLLC